MKAKTKRKVKIYFSMDPDLYELFENHINKNLLDKSKVIEKLIEEYMKNK
jgi:metal-responsive CopG/Arc/MetJ family transcriptional regulator